MKEITFEQFEELYKLGYDLDIALFLKFIDSGVYEYHHPKILALEQTCKRKGLISEEGKVTLEGKKIVEFISSPGKEKLVKKKPINDDFTRWWSTFPGTDSFEYKGRKFKGDRALRVKKDDCKTKINAILNEGDCTIDELIEALKLEIEQKKESSFKSGENKLKYMNNTLTYLRQRVFDPYLELVRSGHKAQEETKTQHFDGVNI